MKHLLIALFLGCSAFVFAQNKSSFLDEKQKKQPADSNTSYLLKAAEIDGSKKIKKNIAIAEANPKLLRARVVKNSEGTPIYVEYQKKLSVAPNGRVAMSAVALAYLTEIKPLLSLTNPEEEIELKTIEEDELSYIHLRLQQQFKGVPVYGGEMILHGKNNVLETLNGRFFPTPKLKNTTPRLSESQAIEQALNDLKQSTVVRDFTANEKQFVKKYKPETELFIYHPNDDLSQEHLAWELTIRPNFVERWVYFIDAHTGQILYKNNHTCALDGPATATGNDLNGVRRTMKTYQKGTTYYLLDITRGMFKATNSVLPNDPVGAIWTLDARNSTEDDISVSQVSSASNAWTATAISAHYNAGVAYDYYLNTFKRNSLDNRGGNILSVINIRDENGKDMGNAFWNGEIMGYGNGDNAFKPLPGGLDVAAHEMTHGVIENTANLEYQGQSGAINESMADVFGILIDRDDWTLGEDVVQKSVFTSGALRSFSNPNQGGPNDPGYQPRTMSQYNNTKQDNGGVHINSGIPNYAFYLFANNANVGKDKAEKVYYRAMTTYLTRISKFLDLRLAIIKSSTDLYGATSNETNAAKAAFDQVGIIESTNPNPTTPPSTIPTNNGTDALLVYGLDQKLYVTSVTGTNLVQKVAREIRNRPSITDDGQLAYYVGVDKKIRAINLTGTPTEQLVSNDAEAIWANVAVSKDGKKLAALTDQADKSLYVYSYDLKKWTKFKLYNPTYSAGVSTGDVQYADAIEWDPSGEYVVYDAYNKIKSLTGEVVDYWDVGLIQVWDNSTNSFSDGAIEKLFSDLENGESIGNPSFAKNSTNVLAFDYLYEPDKTYQVLGTNIDNGKLSLIYDNNTLGTPSYSRLDDKVVFTTKVSNADNIAVININTDKISGKGTPTVILKNAKWPVWFAQGTRALPAISFDAIPDKYATDAPFLLKATVSSGQIVYFQVVSGPAKITGNTLTITGVGTVVIRAYTVGDSRFSPATAVERTFRVSAILSVSLATIPDLVLYPNPVKDLLYIQVPQGVILQSADIEDVIGRKIQVQTLTNNTPIDTKNLSNGLFILKIETNKGIVRRKFVKH